MAQAPKLTKAELNIINVALDMYLTSSNRAINANQGKEAIVNALKEQSADILAVKVKIAQKDMFE